MYWIIVAVCMAVISAINMAVNHLFFNMQLWLIPLLVITYTVAVIIIDLLFAFIVHWLIPAKCYEKDNFLFRTRKWERGFYEKLKIRKWKDKVLDLGALGNFKKDKVAEPNNNEYVKKFIVECNCGYVVHIACNIFGFAALFFYLPYWFCFGLPVALVNLVLNQMSIFVLRYNKPKLEALYKRNLNLQKRAAELKTEATEKQIENSEIKTDNVTSQNA